MTLRFIVGLNGKPRRVRVTTLAHVTERDAWREAHTRASRDRARAKRAKRAAERAIATAERLLVEAERAMRKGAVTG